MHIAQLVKALIEQYHSPLHGCVAVADVIALAHDCDLALLTVEDDDFWSAPEPMLPLQLGSVPGLQEAVMVCGYPTGPTAARV